jgi:hypothetical protein
MKEYADNSGRRSSRLTGSARYKGFRVGFGVRPVCQRRNTRPMFCGLPPWAKALGIAGGSLESGSAVLDR